MPPQKGKNLLFKLVYGMIWALEKEMKMSFDTMRWCMKQGAIQVFGGSGKGKSSAAMGRALEAASEGKRVVVIQFMKDWEEPELLKRLEPEIKVFRFEKSEGSFLDLPKVQQKEEIQNIQNGLHFAKKVLATGECELLILDEVLGLVDTKIITSDTLREILSVKGEEVSVIMTGIYMDEIICSMADVVSEIKTVKCTK